jgi:hypothetical protein
VALIVRATHERWDGHGYPDGLAEDAIPLGGRIIAACDAYDAMTTDRCYRGRVGHDAACAELHRESGKQFDPNVVAALLDELRREGPSPGSATPAPEPQPQTVDEVASSLREVLALHLAESEPGAAPDSAIPGRRAGTPTRRQTNSSRRAPARGRRESPRRV